MMQLYGDASGRPCSIVILNCTLLFGICWKDTNEIPISLIISLIFNHISLLVLQQVQQCHNHNTHILYVDNTQQNEPCNKGSFFVIWKQMTQSFIMLQRHNEEEYIVIND